MNKTAFAVVLALSAAPAGAQVETFSTAQAAVDASRAAQAAAAPARALESTLVAMNDGVEAGGRVIAYLNGHGIAVRLAKQSEAVKTVVEGGKTAIVLSDALPAHPRVYAPLIASEAAKGIYSDMPACGERSYMIMATAARAFVELGGEMKGLPKIDGDDVPAVKDLIAPWSAGAETALDELARRDGVPELPDLQSKAADPAAAAALAAQNKRFTSFLMDESDARREALGR
jgi:hypothetical protein